MGQGRAPADARHHLSGEEGRTEPRLPYSPHFYREQCEGSFSSARRTAPIVVELIRPRSVIDVGCGVGTWLAAFAEAGIEDVTGVDGGHVEPSMLRIDARRFVAHDLSEPFTLERTFDLAVCLEVAEHLRSSAAPGLVETLVALAPVVLFSAAVPGSGGHHHVNEQWPEYWAALFDVHGYEPIDVIRPALWNDPAVDWWYAQNTLLYVSKERRDEDSRLHAAWLGTDRERLALAHPRMVAEVIERGESLRHILASLPGAAARALQRRAPGGRRAGRPRRAR